MKERFLKTLVYGVLGLDATLWSYAVFKKLIEQRNTDYRDFFFLQIGAHDGIRVDPIHKYILRYKWQGLLVEPSAVHFEKLQRNYANVPGLVFEKSAICETEEDRVLFGVSERAPLLIRLTAEALNSLSIETLLWHTWYIPNLSKWITTERVRGITLPSLLTKHKVSRLDLLVIDAEGYDWKIIQQFDFVKMKPEIIYFESKLLSSKEKSACFLKLRKEGYKLTIDTHNTCAYLPGLKFPRKTAGEPA